MIDYSNYMAYQKILGIVVIVIIALVGGWFLMNSNSKPAENETVTSATSNTTQNTNTDVPSDNIYLTKSDPTKGQYITDFDGVTLYTFDKDTTGVSNCDAACAKIWPPYTSGATAQKMFPKNISVIVRSDNSKQFAWNGMPLYYYSKDKAKGDMTGDNVNNTWHIVKP